MPRELWKGAIHFGLVHIPVSLYPAEQSEELSFTMLDRRDLQPVGYKRYNKSTGDEVALRADREGLRIRRRASYVTLEKEDFKRANVEATQTVDIVGFVDAKRHPALLPRVALLPRARASTATRAMRCCARCSSAPARSRSRTS